MTNTEYVAFGRSEESNDYWVATWDADGPTSAETFRDTFLEAERLALRTAQERGLEAVEVDEFGAKPDPEDMRDWRYEVANGDTSLGFGEWLIREQEAGNR